MSEPIKPGQLIDSLGFEMTLREGDMPVGGVILLKVVEQDGSVRLSSIWSEGMSWLEKAGILTVALQAESETNSFSNPGDDDDC